jgi:phosphoenolpyruvate carboxykinase (GTP)
MTTLVSTKASTDSALALAYRKSLIKEIDSWVLSIAELTKPEAIYWCDGSKEEYKQFCDLLVEKGTFIKLNEKKRPNSFACFSDASDVARVEDKTFICSRRKELDGTFKNERHPK